MHDTFATTGRLARTGPLPTLPSVPPAALRRAFRLAMASADAPSLPAVEIVGELVASGMEAEAASFAYLRAACLVNLLRTDEALCDSCVGSDGALSEAAYLAAATVPCSPFAYGGGPQFEPGAFLRAMGRRLS